MTDKYLENKYTELIKTINEYNKKANLDLVRKAFEFADLAHSEQKRLNDDPYIDHCLATAIILAEWKLDEETIIAGLLHDTIEHGAATDSDILHAFGKEVLDLVEGVTKVSKIKLKGSEEEAFVENLRKMFLAIAKDLRIVFLRLAERIDNLKTIKYLPPSRRELYAKDSLEIYAPLAERLGIWGAKTLIDDMAFPYIYPEDYKKVNTLSSPFFLDAEKRIGKMKKALLREFKKQRVNAEIFGRRKSLYSIFNKLKKDEIEWDFDKIYDIAALRVIVNKISECYLALGLLHKLYKPVPQMPLADFIAVPKPNGYRSIHTKVFGPGEKIVEVQIRTREMHEQAEFGAAAHWAYSEAKYGGVKDEVLEKGKLKLGKNKLLWVMKLAKWQKEIKNNKEFLKAVKFDALSRRIFSVLRVEPIAA